MFLKTLAVASCILFLLAACNTSRNPFFAKKTPHEKYSEQIIDAGLMNTRLGILWLGAANNSLKSPQLITLPYQETGFFAADRPAATAFSFSARRGEKILVAITTVPATGVKFFADLWEPGEKATLLTAMDTLNKSFEFSVKKEGQFLLRIQPELLEDVQYNVQVKTGPSLAFPVDDSGNPVIISYWGAGRDNGTRKHEGIDIKAEFRTPALAGTDGYVRATNNNLGGKVIFLNNRDKGYSLYYAHLDSQLVSTGDFVHTGEVVGYIGNTGNARGTLPHLHFGIYALGGAIDPLAFIQRERQAVAPITSPLSVLNQWVHSKNATTVFADEANKNALQKKLPGGEVFLVEAATGNKYRAQLPGGQQIFVNKNSVSTTALKSEKSKKELSLYARPDTSSPIKKMLPPGTSISPLGNFSDYTLVEADSMHGWVLLQ